MQTVHATVISFSGIGILLRGPSGSGKSSLALQLIEQPGTGLWAPAQTARLVSDDQTVLRTHLGGLLATAPANLEGLLEVRGLGVIRVPHDAEAMIGLVVDLAPASQIERMPEASQLTTTIFGIDLPCVAIDSTSPSATSRLRLAVLALTKGGFHT